MNWKSVLILAWFAGLPSGWATSLHALDYGASPNRVASIYISQDFLNEQLKMHSKSELFSDTKIILDDLNDRILLTGQIVVPVDELRAVNLDSKLGVFNFQLVIKLSTTDHGHLILEFPLAETYFYPAVSTHPERDRVVMPVQLLSLALASARGYLSALSGDFSSFDRRTAKLTALLKALDRSVALEKNDDARAELSVQRQSLQLQMAVVPLERAQLMAASKRMVRILGVTGEKELNLNDQLSARENALVLKLRLSQLTPYLEGVELGGTRIVFDAKAGGGQRYFVVDVNSELDPAAVTEAVPMPVPTRIPREPTQVAPALIVRLKETLFDSKQVVEQEKKRLTTKIRDLQFHLKEDGIHVTAGYKILFFTVHFETVVDVNTTGLDEFEVRVRAFHAAGLDLGFLVTSVLESTQKRLEATLKGMCRFQYIGEEKDHSRALRVTVDPKVLVPAFPGLHLVSVDVRDREFLLKIGHPQDVVIAPVKVLPTPVTPAKLTPIKKSGR